MLMSIEPAKDVIAKVGVTNQWLKVKDASGKEGYVAAWYVKYASGSQPAAATPAGTAPAATPAPGGVLKVTATAEGIALRKQPVVSDASLIYRLPLGTVFTVTEANAEGKVGKNDQWLKVKDPNGAEGYVAAWFVARS
jgi:SH3-like domain-containing protein